MMKTPMPFVSDGAGTATGATGVGDDGAADAETSGLRQLQTGPLTSQHNAAPDSRDKPAAVPGLTRS